MTTPYETKRDDIEKTKNTIENRIYTRKLIYKFKTIFYKLYFNERREIFQECIDLINNQKEYILNELNNINTVKTHESLKKEQTMIYSLQNHFQYMLLETDTTNWGNTLLKLAYEDEFRKYVIHLWIDNINTADDDSSSVNTEKSTISKYI